MLSKYYFQESECLSCGLQKTSGFTLKTLVTCQSLVVYICQGNNTKRFFTGENDVNFPVSSVSFPCIFSHLQGVVGAWGARRLWGCLTTAGRVVAAVLLGGIWVVHQKGQLSEMALPETETLKTSQVAKHTLKT